jgi:Putative MetA-pathway of phenol degradation
MCQARSILIRISIAVLPFLLVARAPLHSQCPPATTDTPGPIVTDRPTVTNSSIVVPSGSLQAENGFPETERQGQNIADGPETLLRFGVATKTELGFTAPDYYYDLSGSGGGSGFGDLAIGVKQQLGPNPVSYLSSCKIGLPQTGCLMSRRRSDVECSAGTSRLFVGESQINRL